MIYMFLDESGECSFSAKTEFEYFLITILLIEETELKRLKNISKRTAAKFIARGWNKDREIKAVNLYKNKKFGEASVVNYLDAVSKLESLRINYLAVNKGNISNESFKKTPYGIGYNYFTGQLLSELIFNYDMYDIHLTYDERNKESHPNQSFQQFLQTKIYGIAFEKGIEVNMGLTGANSRMVYGLMAVDFFCWSIYRKITTGDDTFINKFAKKLLHVNELYI